MFWWLCGDLGVHTRTWVDTGHGHVLPGFLLSSSGVLARGKVLPISTVVRIQITMHPPNTIFHLELLIGREAVEKQIVKEISSMVLIILSEINAAFLRLFILMLDRDEESGNITSGFLLGGICKERLLTDSFDILRVMLGKVKTPDFIICYTLVTGLFESGIACDATSLFNSMSHVDSYVQPDVLNPSVLICGLCQEDYLNKAAIILTKMFAIIFSSGLLNLFNKNHKKNIQKEDCWAIQSIPADIREHIKCVTVAILAGSLTKLLQIVGCAIIKKNASEVCDISAAPPFWIRRQRVPYFSEPNKMDVDGAPTVRAKSRHTSGLKYAIRLNYRVFFSWFTLLKKLHDPLLWIKFIYKGVSGGFWRGDFRKFGKSLGDGVTPQQAKDLRDEIDSLDTLALLGDRERFTASVEWIGKNLRFDINKTVSIFETTIRVLGGLISAHLIASHYNTGMRIPSYDDELLHLAEDLARRMLPAFDTPTGIPFGSVNLLHGVDEK